MSFVHGHDALEGSLKKDVVVRLVLFGLSSDKVSDDYKYISGRCAILDMIMPYGALTPCRKTAAFTRNNLFSGQGRRRRRQFSFLQSLSGCLDRYSRLARHAHLA